MENQSIKAFIWDMGGVLLRTVDFNPRQHLAERFGITHIELVNLVFQSESALKAETGNVSYQEHWDYVCTKLGIRKEDLPDFLNDFFDGDQIDHDLVLFIISLRRAYRVGLLSNALPGVRAQVNMRFNGLLDLFDDVIFSSEVGFRKPDDRIFKLALKRIKVTANEAVFIDDMIENVNAARKVGMCGIQFKDTNQVKKEIMTLLDGAGVLPR